MKRTNQVQGWLQSVEVVMAEIDQLFKAQSQETEKLCLGGCCSTNCKSSYKFGNKVVKMLQVVDSLQKKGRDFGDNAAKRIPEDPMDKLPIERTKIGQDTVFDKLCRCLREEHVVGIIGLYGTGGVGKTTLLTQIGKTTLLTQINNKFCDEQLDFDVVIWNAVSKKLRLEKIQENIGKKIGPCDQQWKNQTFQEKAQDILKVLSQKKFVLLLDDIWNHVDLREVGIPNTTSTSKIIFTTRFEEVCCQMHAHKYFRVVYLGHDEAWELFQKNLQRVMLDRNPNILEQAKKLRKSVVVCHL
ncbi:hypothetical protein Dsin_013571 [Dipteronia sinensis]|uniref:NB-ARC domain-containing protein n=1 Tax=Dipteronia sinensis TaxID=43782 RepID=A0AAE0AKD7_9ROSI|nr:hypothetical protein Dsin_013571 [Dipteronia sinensis]